MKSAETAVQYYQDTRKEDYYLNGIGREGHWLGQGAASFGLAGTVRRDQFRNLLRGLSHDGERPLVQNADRPDRACCWDFTFNAPKSVSVLWALAPADQRSQIEEAHHRAVQAAVARAEQVGGITRRGTGGKKKERAQLVWAAFQEGTSRAQDPHLHTHAVLLNIGLRADGSTGSIHTPDLFQWKMALGAIYQAELAAQLRQRPGCTIVPDKVAFRIEAVPQEVCRALSKRRAVIESTMEERGVSGAVAAKAVATYTRPKKEELPPSLLLPRWQAIAQGHDWDPVQALRPTGHAHTAPVSREQLRALVQEAADTVPPGDRRQSRVVRAAARIALTQGADGTMLFDTLKAVLWNGDHRATHTSNGSRKSPPSQERKKQEQGQAQEPIQVDHRAGPDRAVGERDRSDPPPHRLDATGKLEARRPTNAPIHSRQETTERSPNDEFFPKNPSEIAPQRPARSGHATSGKEAAASGRQGSGAKSKSPSKPKKDRSGHDATPRRQKGIQTETLIQWSPAVVREFDPRLANTPWNRKMLFLKWKSLAYSSSIESPLPKTMVKRSDEQDQRNAEFASAFQQWLSGATREQKKVKDMTYQAVGLACRFGADTEALRGGLGRAIRENNLQRNGIPGPKPFIRVEWKHLFPKAPGWSPASKWKAPVVVIGPRDPRWWSIRWKLNLKVAELRIQDRVVFPNAASWTGLRGLTLPAFRLTRKKSKFKNKSKRQRQEPTRSRSTSESRSQSKDQGHSH